MNRIAVGEEPFVVFVAEGTDGSTDLFAVSAGGGPVHQITYNRPVESHPALSPDGAALAFLRESFGGDSTTREVVVMNLLNAAERRVALPPAAGVPLMVAWHEAGGTLVVRTTAGAWEVAAPPAEPRPRPLDAGELARADTLLAVGIGRPVFALVEACGPGLCAVGGEGQRQELTSRGSMPFRWGADSLAWFDQGRIEVRPLGAGRSRQVMWSREPRNPRQATYAPGVPGNRRGESGLMEPRAPATR